MKREALRTAVAVASSLFIGLGVPLAFALYFRAEGPIVWLLAAAAGMNGLFLLRVRLARKTGGERVPIRRAVLRAAVTALLVLLYASAAVVLVVYIIVIPFSYYLAWLGAVSVLEHGGLISFLFFGVTVWFSSLLAGLVHSSGPARPAAGAAAVVLFELAVIFRTPLTAVLFTLALVAVTALLARGGRKSSPRRLVLPLALFAGCSLTAALFSIGSQPNSGVLTRTSLLTDIKRAIVEAFPDMSALVTVSGYGYSFEKTGLGRRPILSTVPLLSARGGGRRVAYIRTQVYDDYFNNDWGVSPFFAERLAAVRNDVLAAPRRGEPVLSLTVIFDYFPQLPHTLAVSAVDATSVPPVAIVDGNVDTVFDLTLPLLKGATVRIYEPSPEGAETALKRAGWTSPEGGGPREGEDMPGVRPVPPGPERDTLLDRYLIIPSTVTPRIFDLALRLKGRETSAWKILSDIGDYLKKNYPYTLDTVETPAGGEFVDDFLFETRKGYCVHFATAFVVLARCAGVPARYATGFLAVFPPGGGETKITGLNAHAWPEAWIDGVGWVSLEATPAFEPGSDLLPDYYRRFNRRGDEQTARQLQALMGDRVPVPAGPKPAAGVFLGRLVPVLPFAGAALGLAAAAFLLWPAVKKAALRRRRRFALERRLRRLNRPLCRLVSLMERRGAAPPEDGGWLAWSEAVGRLVPPERRRVRTLALKANRIFFSRAPVGKRYLRFVRGLTARLARRLREK
ncbi:MAG: transglutaminase domain-containing protein [Spirochaetales bacterium]|nr:transglutaminase domain-containing protein [Spirochaetales bacterium]